MTDTIRYSDEELQEFKAHIEQKIEKAVKDLDFLEEQIKDVADSREGEVDPMDDSFNASNFEMLHSMASRGRKHIQDLENALVRIKNKSYGICTITGEKIDKRRLIAVPTTAKSLAAKNAVITPEELKVSKPKPATPGNKPNTIISRIIRKEGAIMNKKNIIEDDEDDEDDDLYDDELSDDEFKDDQMDLVEYVEE